MSTGKSCSPLSPKAHGTGQRARRNETLRATEKVSSAGFKTTVTLFPRNPVVGFSMAIRFSMAPSVICLRVNQLEQRVA